ncbi:hypothetical protein SAMN05192558_104322 [Actinokineospora alba]|uniref:Uncharacterized protein n=1 Tax=Actinokineospora alba TaxID=504798 RepID=A0A1H0LXD7_9PSEU|nr:hypothetical protein [Actinokineospora alba]TDP67494.1 hypothetical protein C8E96_3039 [Actinokineospora alba]SDI47027.1 hypothetical protein SAMN05421871_105138 [Actinokineospora alba]SDO72797.1 hypothetical protein SAMN05192558_104322 [Actinokineospora alba]
MAIWTAGEILIVGSLPTIVAALAPPGLQGAHAGISGMSWAAGAIAAPTVGMALLPLGPNVLWGGVGLIGADYASLIVEILADNADPVAGALHGDLDMPFATFVGQLATAYADR